MALAALLTAPGEPLEVVEVELAPPRATEVRVRLAASGVCHTDLMLATSTERLPLPLLLGHEGAGVVTEVGAAVDHLAAGDHVVLSAIPQCGRCFYCRRGQRPLCTLWTGTKFGRQPAGGTRFSLDGRPVYQFGATGTFAEETVVPAASAVKVDPAMPLDLAALIGCSVTTAFGAARRVAAIQPGADVVAVVGAGGVGLNLIQAARLAEAAHVVAIDRVGWKLELATKFGATTTVLADDDPAAAVRALTDGRGADVVFEAVGSTTTILAAIALARPGGHVVVIGAPDGSAELRLNFRDAVQLRGLTISGCVYGNADVHQDFPELVSLYRQGRLLLDELVTQRSDLVHVNDVLQDLRHGRVARSLLVYGGSTPPAPTPVS